MTCLCQEIENFHNFSLHSFGRFFYMCMKIAIISIWANFAANLCFHCAMPEKFQWQPAVCIWINDRVAIWTRMLRLNSSKEHPFMVFVLSILSPRNTNTHSGGGDDGRKNNGLFFAVKQMYRFVHFIVDALLVALIISLVVFVPRAHSLNNKEHKPHERYKKKTQKQIK